MAEVKILCDNRDLIIRVLRDVTGEEPVYHPLPRFEYSVGAFTVTRDGYVVCNNELLNSQDRTEKCSGQDSERIGREMAVDKGDLADKNDVTE